MADCRPVKTPMVPGTHLEKASEEDAAKGALHASCWCSDVAGYLYLS